MNLFFRISTEIIKLPFTGGHFFKNNFWVFFIARKHNLGRISFKLTSIISTRATTSLAYTQITFIVITIRFNSLDSNALTSSADRSESVYSEYTSDADPLMTMSRILLSFLLYFLVLS